MKVGGASAGSLLAACLKSGLPLDDVVEQNLRLMSEFRRGGTRGRMGVCGCGQCQGGVGGAGCRQRRAGMGVVGKHQARLDPALNAPSAAAPAPLQTVLRSFLDASLPEDAHERCRDRAYVSPPACSQPGILRPCDDV